MPSVKEFRVDEAPSDGLGNGRFYFTDAYSVFDWGQMPDTIPGKGASLCTMGAYTFERLADEGVPTHYRGVIPPVAEDTTPVALSAVEAPPREMAIDLATVPELPHDGRTYDYEAYHEAAGPAYLIPLEIIFRNVVPNGSSLRDRSSPVDHGLSFDTWPDRAVDLPEPIIEFSTKLEDGDRYLTPEEADRIAGAPSLADLEAVARDVNDTITERARAAGFTHQDGKIECIAVDGEVRVADVAGTFDENRFAYDGVQISKEVLRQYYRRTQPEWVDAIKEAKASAQAADDPDWKARCSETPAPLPESVLAVAVDLYTAGANAYIDRDLFEAPGIDAAVADAREL